jgi:hypothetical protein
MTVALSDDGAVRLEGDCPIDDAEALLRYLVETPGATIDWRDCERVHTAIVGVLLASGAPLRGPPAGAFLREWIAPSLVLRTGGTTPFPKGAGMP